MQNEQPQPFGQFLKAYFKNLWQMIKHPWAFIPTLLLSAAWIVLGIAQTRMAASPAFDWANFFTFTQGGLFGGLAGAIGGIVGKILIATLLNALIMPLFMKGSRPFAKFGRGIGGFFKSFAFNSLSAMSWFLMGISLALMIYSVMNITQRWQEGLVGVAGAILLIKSIGQRGGMLFSLLFSFAKGFTRRGRVPSYVGIMRFLSGMAVGFTAGTVLNAFGLRWAVFIAACAFAIAILFIWFGKRQRAAFTTVAIAALLMVPVYADSPSCLVSPVQQSQDALKAAGKKHAKELQPYVDEINRCIAVVQSQNENTPQAEQDEAQRQLEAAQKNYHDALVAFARRDGGQAAEMPQEMKELYDKANDQSISGKVERLQQLAAEAEARGDHAAADRYANEIAQLYMNQANDAMKLMEMAQQIQLQHQDLGDIGSEPITVIGDGTGNPFGDSPDGDFSSGSGDPNGNDPYGNNPSNDDTDTPGVDANPFGKGPGADDLDWKPKGEESILTKLGLDDETSEQIEKVATEGWADESSQVEDEDDVTMWEGIGAGAAAATAAGAAAGAAGGAGGAGGGLPDLPDGDWEATEPEERDEEEDEDEEEDDTEGGDGGDGDGDGDGEYEDEETGDEPEQPEEDGYEDVEAPEEVEQPEEPEEAEEAEQPAEGKDPFGNNPYVTRNPDGSITMTSPSTGEKIDLEPDGNGGWTNLRSGVEYDNNDVNEWVRSQDENGDHWKNQQATNQQYQEAFEKDAAEFASHSEQARLDDEIERENAQALLDKGFTPEKCNDIRVTAMQYGIDVDDEDGNPRDIELVKQDTETMIRIIQRMENANQAVYAQEELDASLYLADAELIDNVAEGTINILGETVPGGKVVKDAHNFAKATLVGGMEAYTKGRSVAGGLVGGAVEGGFTVAQNHLGDVSKAYGTTGVKQIVFEGAGNIYLEGTKTLVHDLTRGESLEDAVENAQAAMVKKTGDVAISTVFGGVMDKAYGGDGSNNAELAKAIVDNSKAGIGEIYGRAHDMMTMGKGDNEKNISQMINDSFSDWKNSKVESMYLAYYGVKE